MMVPSVDLLSTFAVTLSAGRPFSISGITSCSRVPFFCGWRAVDLVVLKHLTTAEMFVLLIGYFRFHFRCRSFRQWNSGDVS